MQADSSDSDCEFTETASTGQWKLDKHHPQIKILLACIKSHYKPHYETLRALKISDQIIIDIFKTNKDKFIALSSKEVFNLISRSPEDTNLFNRLSSIYESDQFIFWKIVNGDELIDDFGMDTVHHQYKFLNKQSIASRAKCLSDSDNEEEDHLRIHSDEEKDIYRKTGRQLKHDADWDYQAYFSDDSGDNNDDAFYQSGDISDDDLCQSVQKLRP